MKSGRLYLRRQSIDSIKYTRASSVSLEASDTALVEVWAPHNQNPPTVEYRDYRSDVRTQVLAYEFWLWLSGES